MTADTTTSAYWLNWRVLVCAISVVSSIIAASFLIWKYEAFSSARDDRGENHQERGGSLHEYESWRPCLKEIHPAWLLVFRFIAFLVLLALLTANAVIDGGGIFYFYTQWTFTLVTFYFGLGTSLSIYGCYQIFNKVGSDRVERMGLDAERGIQMACLGTKNSSQQAQHFIRRSASIWVYIFQIVYQTSAGAVMLTDVVFWLIIFPFLASKDYTLSLLLFSMHSVNAIFLLAETALNCLRFPWFRFSYFVLWTAIYVIFQWILHAAIPLWWPYPFLDLSSPYAPLWYLAVAVLHIPCYAIFLLIIRTKHYLLSKWFPQSYQCSK